MKSTFLIKPALLLLLTTAITLSVRAQETRNVAIKNFTGVAVSVGINLFVTQGNTENAKIVAKSDLIDEVIIDQEGDQVRVHWKENNGRDGHNKNKSAKVYINCKTLTGLSASTGSSIVTENTINTGTLTAKASTGATINAKITCSNLELSTSTGANVSISGTATNVNLKASTGANINALNLVSEYAKAKVSTGSNIKLNAAKGLEAATSTGGSINYKGAASVTAAKKASVRHID